MRITEAPQSLGAGPGSGRDATPDHRKAAADFEAMTLDQMLQPMFATIGAGDGMFDGGAAEQTLKPMLVTEFARMMEQRGGLGMERAIMAAMAEQGTKRS